MPITAAEILEVVTMSDCLAHAVTSPITTAQPVSTVILFISAVPQDQSELRRILCPTHRTISSATCRRAVRQIRKGGLPIVVCDRDLPDGTWLDILSQVAASDDPPLLIVTSPLADERLWAEVLNLGGFDLIAKPFAAKEVLHVLRTALVYRCSPARSTHFAGGA